MDFETIVESIESGEVKLTSMDLTNIVVMAATKDDHINCDILKNVITALQGVKKTAAEDFKEMKKEMENANKEIVAARARQWFDTLEVGTEISWIANGVVVYGTKGEQKPGLKRAHTILNEVEPGKKPDRHVPFDKLQVPEDFVVEEVA